MPTLRIDNLFARRSIRKYTSEPVTEVQIETLLKAAMAAPSAADRKPWQYVVVQDAATRAALVEVHPNAKMLLEAPVCIVPCADPTVFPEFWVQDLAATTENILLAATGLGLGTVWCGVYPNEDRVAGVRRVLGVPEGIVPFCLIAVGHAAEAKEPRTQYDEARVHRKRW